MKKPFIHKTNAVEAYILAGGLSTRMGRDKGRLHLGRGPMIGHVQTMVRQLEISVRTIRRDPVSRCGPIGGIYTALKRSRAEVVVILACDMPFVSPEFLKRMAAAMGPRTNALFAHEKGLAGFPCLFRREICLPVVWRQIAQSEYSLQALLKALEGRMMGSPRDGRTQLANLNTPLELEKARLRVRKRSSP